MVNKKLSVILNKIANEDQRMRKKRVFDASVDIVNTTILKKIVKQYGWPTTSLVGKKASFNAWLIAQHADHDLKFQKMALVLLSKEHQKTPSEPPKEQIAYLTDRICVNEGREQIYGTQFYVSPDGRYLCRPIANIVNLDVRRAQMNLGKFSEYEQKLKKFYGK